GDGVNLARALDQAGDLIAIARRGAAWRNSQGRALGVDGRGWLARAEAEWGRANGTNDPAAWRKVVEVFGPGFVYETARSRWRLAEALAEAGERAAAREELALATAAAKKLRAAPLLSALADLGRRARISGQAGEGHGQLGVADGHQPGAFDGGPLSG